MVDEKKGEPEGVDQEDCRQIAFSEAKDKEEVFAQQAMNSSLGGDTFQDAAVNLMGGVDQKMFPPRDWEPVKKIGLFSRFIRWLAQAWVDFSLWREQKELVVKFKKLDPQAIPPRFAKSRDSGADLSSVEDMVIPPGEVRMVKTGIALQLPVGHEGQVRSRSGLAAKSGIQVFNAPGTLDNPYRGEVCVILHNASRVEFKVERGMRIAQLVVMPVPRAVYKQVDSLGSTERGADGFGSTGVK